MSIIYRKQLASVKYNRPKSFQFLTTGDDRQSGPISWCGAIEGNVVADGISYLSNVVPQLTYDEIVNSLSPVVYWRLGEATTATTAVDEMGVVNGTYTNSPALVDGAIGVDPNGAKEFNDSAWQKMVAPSNTIFPDGNESRSVALWMKYNDNGLPSNPIFQHGDTWWTSFICYANTEGNVCVSRGETSAGIYYGVVDDGIWHHLVVTYDGTKVRVYKDGLLLSQEHDVSLSGTVQGDFRLAWFNWEWYADGVLDEVSVWNRCLTEEEIGTLYSYSLGNYSSISTDTDLAVVSVGVFVANNSGVDTVTINRSRSWKNDNILLYDGLPNITYVDVGYPFNTIETYKIDYYNSAGEKVYEQDELTGPEITKDEWLIISGGGTIPLGHTTSYAWIVTTDADYSRRMQTEAFDVFNSKYQRVSRGNILGRDGAIGLVADAADRVALLDKVKDWMDNTSNVCIKTPYGDTVFVVLGEPSAEWFSIGHIQMSLPYVEVDAILGGLLV